MNEFSKYFGLKAHSGVDSHTKQVHSAAVTATNVHDSRVLEDLLHGGDTRVWGDSAYAGQSEVLAEHAPLAQDYAHARGCRNRPLTDEDKRRKRTKSGVRAKVEHIFRVLKRQFGFTKVRYRGLDKNANHLFAAFALVNIVMAKRRLLRLAQAQCVRGKPKRGNTADAAE
jgi:transposase, IS5 family